LFTRFIGAIEYPTEHLNRASPGGIKNHREDEKTLSGLAVKNKEHTASEASRRRCSAGLSISERFIMKTLSFILLALLVVGCSLENPVESVPEWTPTTSYYLSISQTDFPSLTKIDVYLNYVLPQPKAVRLDVGQLSFSTDNLIIVNPARDVKYFLSSFLFDKSVTGQIRVFVKD
jgi:hypothetical protein